jgi:hypothetical protein
MPRLTYTSIKFKEPPPITEEEYHILKQIYNDSKFRIRREKKENIVFLPTLKLTSFITFRINICIRS